MDITHTQNISKKPDDPFIVELVRKYENEPIHLKSGSRPVGFPLLPREILANWILCIPLLHDANHECVMTAPLQEDGTDGGVFDTTTGLHHKFQHVYVPTLETPKGAVREINDLFSKKFELKARKGKVYADGVELVIFSDAIGLVEPTTINKIIKGNHGFKSVYALAIEKKDRDGYHYWLTVLDSPRKYFTFRIVIPYNCDFHACKVTQTH